MIDRELREPGAYNQVMALVPTPDEAPTRRLLHKGLAQAASYGITSIHNNELMDLTVALTICDGRIVYAGD